MDTGGYDSRGLGVVIFSDSFSLGTTTWVMDRLIIPEADCLVPLTRIIVIEKKRLNNIRGERGNF